MAQQNKKTRTTLQDVADQVGVTKMTVSRYMRNPESVAEKTRAKIATAIEEMGYIENRAPAMLSSPPVKPLVFYCRLCPTKFLLPLFRA